MTMKLSLPQNLAYFTPALLRLPRNHVQPRWSCSLQPPRAWCECVWILRASQCSAVPVCHHVVLVEGNAVSRCSLASC